MSDVREQDIRDPALFQGAVVAVRHAHSFAARAPRAGIVALAPSLLRHKRNA